MRTRQPKSRKVRDPSQSRPCTEHSDCGCEDIAQCCLKCSLSTCIFDIQRGRYRRSLEERNKDIRAMRQAGMRPGKIAFAMALDRRTVHRVLEDGS